MLNTKTRNENSYNYLGLSSHRSKANIGETFALAFHHSI